MMQTKYKNKVINPNPLSESGKTRQKGGDEEELGFYRIIEEFVMKKQKNRR